MPKKPTRNAQGSGTIRQRPDGRWEARYTAGRNPGTGRQIQRSVYGDTQAEVLKQLRQIHTAIDSGTYTEPSRMTVADWLDVWLNDYTANIKPSTKDSYTGRIKHRIKPSLGAVKLTALAPHMVQSFYNSLQPALSAKSIFNIHGILHKAMQQALELGYIRTNPTAICKLPRVEKPPIKPLDNEQVQAFMAAIKGHKYEVFYLADMFLGLRQGELLGLTWDCISWTDGTVTVSRQLQFLKGVYTFRPLKNNKPRRITPAGFVMDILKEHQRKQFEMRIRAGKAWQDGGFVFCNETGEHLSRSTTYHNFKRICASIGIPERRLHDLRHTFAVMSLQAGDDAKTLQENMGHHSAAFTLDVYGHVTERMKKESAARMDAYIDKLKHG